MSDAAERRSSRRLGTAVRLSGFVALLLAIVLGFSAWATWLSFTRRSTGQASADVAAALQDFNRAAASKSPAIQIDDWVIHYLSITVLPANEKLIIGLPNHTRYGSSGSGRLLGQPAVRHLVAHPPVVVTSVSTSHDGQSVLLLAAPIRQGGATVGTVIAAYELGSITSDQHRVLLLAIVEALIALVAAVVGTYVVLRRLLGKVGHITATAQTIEAGELDRRLGDQGTDDEVGELAATFDSMLDRIDGVMAVQRRLLSDVSHQLRTPLTVVRGHLEVLARTGVDDPTEVRETIETVVDELEHMRALTEQLLMLGRALEPDFVETAPIDLRAFLGDIAASGAVLGNREVRVGAIPDVVIAVDEAKLRGALLNLVDNAVKATVDGDSIEISAELRDADGEVALTVGDSGPGIPESQRARVLERFGRPDTETGSGSGLGLAIVGTVAAAHGGRFELGDARIGGLAATIVLPASVILEFAHTEGELR